MKRFITSAILALLITFYLPACKKSDKRQKTLEKIQGVWQLVTDIKNKHISGQDSITTITGVPGDILDFRKDGIVYVETGGNKDSLNYSLSGDTKIYIGFTFQTFDITTLTANSFVLHYKEIFGDNFDEETISLKK